MNLLSACGRNQPLLKTFYQLALYEIPRDIDRKTQNGFCTDLDLISITKWGSDVVCYNAVYTDVPVDISGLQVLKWLVFSTLLFPELLL